MTGALDRRGSRALFLLAALSGACGIAYEIIYIRLISNYFGSDFAVTATILSAVFFGMAFGAWHSARLVRHLAWIELVLGLYAFALAGTLWAFGFGVVTFGGTSSVVTLAKLGLLLVVPAFLIGTCVPLFTAYAEAAGGAGRSWFPAVYMLYNMGAFSSGLAIEFFLFRHLGLTVTTFIIGAVNIFVGSALLLGRFAANRPAGPSPVMPARRIALALFTASVASGVFQLYYLRLSYAVFGPHQENFAIVLVAALMGLFVGAALTRAMRISFEAALCGAAGLAALLLLGATPLVYLWSWLQTSDLSPELQGAVKIAVLGGFALPVFIMLGMTVPLAARAHDGASPAPYGKLLAIASAGNGTGALLMLSVLFAWLPLGVLGAAIAVCLLASWGIVAGPRVFGRRGLTVAGAICSVFVAALLFWPAAELALGYRAIADLKQLGERRGRIANLDQYKKLDQSTQLVSFDDDQVSLILNGYQSLLFGPGSTTPLRETIVGASPALFSARTNKALVFGMGSGITAGAAAEVFGQVTVIEINPTVLRVLPYFAELNGKVREKPNVEIRIEDGITTLLKSGATYDAIVNTVTSPHYYASSKLYTADFLALVRTRLANGGMYSSWFDLTIGHEGVDIIVNTLEKSFGACRYILLSFSYFNAVCGDTLELRPAEELVRRYESPLVGKALTDAGVTLPFHEFAQALGTGFAPSVHQRQSSKINTLDLPHVEFVIARSSDSGATIQYFLGLIDRNVRMSLDDEMAHPSFADRCAAVAVMIGTAPLSCHEKVQSGTGRSD